MSSAVYARPGIGDVQGWQRPRILRVPEFGSSTGEEAVELAAMVGLDLDPWQQFVLVNALGERPDGSWASREVGVEVPRQNGKGGILEARELAGLFLLGERLIIHSAHEFATAEEALERMALLLESNDELMRRVRTIKRSHGQEGVYLKNGQRLRYKTRTKGGGRGFTADCVILDEAMHIPEAMHGALFPTLRAIPNPQVWYTGSAVDQDSMDNGVVFARVRDRALEGGAKGLAYFGWSPPFGHPNEVPEEAFHDPEVWAQANPALGGRISAEYMAQELESMSRRSFAVELLGVGDWPRTDGSAEHVISPAAWKALTDEGSQIAGECWFAFDVTPDRARSSIAVAGRRPDGRLHVEVVDHRPGTAWVTERLLQLAARPDAGGVVLCDSASPAASLVARLQEAGVDVQTTNPGQHAQACGIFFDACEQDTMRHLGTPELAASVRGAVRRPLGDAWGWSRKSSDVDISPLVAATLALWKSDAEAASVYDERGVLSISI